MDASYRNYAGRTPFCILLGSQEAGQEELQVAAAEVLLGVMEGLFVDNARIEYEGAAEVRLLTPARLATRPSLVRAAYTPSAFRMHARFRHTTVCAGHLVPSCLAGSCCAH